MATGLRSRINALAALLRSVGVATRLTQVRTAPEARPTNLLFTSAVLLLIVLLPAAAVMEIPPAMSRWPWRPSAS